MSAFLMTAFRSDMIARFQKSGIYVRRFHKKRLYAPSPSIFGHLSPFCPSFNDHINRSTTGNNNKSPEDEWFVSLSEGRGREISFVLWVVGIAESRRFRRTRIESEVEFVFPVRLESRKLPRKNQLYETLTQDSRAKNPKMSSTM